MNRESADEKIPTDDTVNTDTMAIQKRNAHVMKEYKSKELVERSLDQVLDGNLASVPIFVSSLFDFLGEDVPSAANRSAFVADMSQKTMYVLGILFARARDEEKKCLSGPPQKALNAPNGETSEETRQDSPIDEDSVARIVTRFDAAWRTLAAATCGYLMTFSLLKGYSLGGVIRLLLPKETLPSSLIAFLACVSLVLPSTLSFFILSCVSVFQLSGNIESKSGLWLGALSTIVWLQSQNRE